MLNRQDLQKVWTDLPEEKTADLLKPTEQATADCYTYHEWDCLLIGTLGEDRLNHMLDCQRCGKEYIRHIKADRQ